MKLFLIRHGETVDNVAQLYAGTTDSALTVHGTVQAQRLATHFARTKPVITHIFSSPLQRAAKTAESILAEQDSSSRSVASTITQLASLQEKSFGSLERKAFRAKGHRIGSDSVTASSMMPDASGTSMESKVELAARADSFLDTCLVPLLKAEATRSETVVAIVSHGLLLSSLWKCLLAKFDAPNVYIDHEAATSRARNSTGLEHLGAWSNTGYLEVELCQLPPYLRNRIKPEDLEGLEKPGKTHNAYLPVLRDWTMTIKGINCRDHLHGLKRTGGGVGSSKFEQDQPTIESFFKRQRFS